MGTFRLRALSGVPFWLCAAAMATAAQADTDACTVLTPAQVGVAVGVPVAAGQHVTPTFVKTCTWTPSGDSAVKSVTLFLQTATSYDGGKPAGVGDDSYYFVAGDQVGLLAKKGSLAFKVAVYATLPIANKEAMELALAKAVLAKL
jgi:hypothetical protein